MYDVIIIGAGVAGFTAAIFTSRRGLKTLVLGKDIGGQANYTDLIENYPSQEEIGGFELVSNIKKQAEKFGAEFEQAEVSRIKQAEDSFVVTAYGKQHKSESLILAYGNTPRDLGVPGEEEFKGKGITYCANCDAALYKDKTVAVVGVGDIAADAGLLCSKYAKKVYVLSKTDKFTAHPALAKALFNKTNVELVPNIQIQQLFGDDHLTHMQLLDLITGQQKKIAIDGLFVELGYIVNSQIAADLVKLDEQQQVIVDKNQATSVLGVFAAGDCTDSNYKQAAISAGEAATAALACFDWLQHRRGGVGLTSDWTQIKRIK